MLSKGTNRVSFGHMGGADGNYVREGQWFRGMGLRCRTGWSLPDGEGAKRSGGAAERGTRLKRRTIGQEAVLGQGPRPMASRTLT